MKKLILALTLLAPAVATAEVADGNSVGILAGGTTDSSTFAVDYRNRSTREDLDYQGQTRFSFQNNEQMSGFGIEFKTIDSGFGTYGDIMVGGLNKGGLGVFGAAAGMIYNIPLGSFKLAPKLGAGFAHTGSNVKVGDTTYSDSTNTGAVQIGIELRYLAESGSWLDMEYSNYRPTNKDWGDAASIVTIDGGVMITDMFSVGARIDHTTASLRRGVSAHNTVYWGQARIHF